MKQIVLAVDPGKASGIALISRESDSEPVLELSVEVTQEEFAGPIREILAKLTSRQLEIPKPLTLWSR